MSWSCCSSEITLPIRITPRRSKSHAAEPAEAPCFVSAVLTFPTDRFLLFVAHSMRSASRPPSAKPSYITKSSSSPAAPPAPLAIARSMFSFGIFTLRAFSTATRSLKFFTGSGPPPSLAATVISRAYFAKITARRLSATPFVA